jgi:hypothetical protein
MKPLSQNMYRQLHRRHTARFIVAVCLLSWVAIGSILAGFFGFTMPAIWGMLVSIFLLVVSLIEGRLCETYYDKWMRAAAKGE